MQAEARCKRPGAEPGGQKANATKTKKVPSMSPNTKKLFTIAAVAAVVVIGLSWLPASVKSKIFGS